MTQSPANLPRERVAFSEKSPKFSRDSLTVRLDYFEKRRYTLSQSKDPTMRKPLLLLSFVIAVWHGPAASTGLTQEKPKKRPNIVIILADDLGYADAGFQGCKDIPTPHIDSIAKNGVRFTSGYVSGPYCSPTRAGLMTGRYQ